MNTQKTYIKKITILDDKSSPAARAIRLKMVRHLANLSRKELCSLCKINIHTLIGWEVARFGGLPLDGAEKIIAGVAEKGVQCTLDWLIHEIGAGPTVVTDYITAKIDSKKKEQEINSLHNNKQPITELVLFRKQYSDAISLQIADDGMSPFYNEGDYVAGVKQYGTTIQSAVGQDCIVQCSNGQILLRNLRLGTEPGKYTLVCTNPQTKVSNPILYNIEITSAAKVARVYRNIKLL
ncbi:MAG: hypothetical protein M1561_05305 [Gammaproteobacteria bacterium]|nr:hypothetical protein [Gammaproteobacteria bacterium]